MSKSDIGMFGTRELREDGESFVIEIPKDAVEQSGLEPGGQAMVGATEDGPVTLVPWSEDDIRSMIRD